MKSIYHKLLIPLLVIATTTLPVPELPSCNEHVLELYTVVKNNPGRTGYFSTEAERAIVDWGCLATGITSLEMYQQAIEYAKQCKDTYMMVTLQKRIYRQRYGTYVAIAGAVALVAPLVAIIKYVDSVKRPQGNNAGKPAHNKKGAQAKKHNPPRRRVLNPGPPLDPSQMLECGICFDQKSSTDCATLACSHRYCRDCLQSIVDQAVLEKTTAQLKCPTVGCVWPIDQEDVREITDNDAATISTLSEITTREWLLTQPDSRACPTPDCQYAFINDGTNRVIVDCRLCMSRYCSNCLINHPSNQTCDQARAQRAIDKNSAEWMSQNTKPCPNCNTRIEKNEGCLYMTCRQCRHGFCWNCNGTHHVFECHQPAAPRQPIVSAHEPEERKANAPVNRVNIQQQTWPRAFDPFAHDFYGDRQ